MQSGGYRQTVPKAEEKEGEVISPSKMQLVGRLASEQAGMPLVRLADRPFSVQGAGCRETL